MSDFQNDFLTPEERRNYIFNDIPYNVWSTRSGASILADLKAGGLGINEGDFYRIRDTILSDIANTEKIAGLNDSFQIPAAFHNEARFWYMESDFAYKVGFRVIDPRTGQEVDRWTTVQSDSRLTKGDIIGAGLDRLESEEDDYKYIVLYSIGLNAQHRPGLYEP